MAKYLLNTTTSTYLFKGGNLEIEPTKSKEVTNNDFNSGIFEAAILSGALLCFDTAEEVPLITGTVHVPEKIETLSKGAEPGATNDEIIAFLEKQKSKAEAAANKYKVENTENGIIEITATETLAETTPIVGAAETKIESEVKTKRTSRKSTTQEPTSSEAS